MYGYTHWVQTETLEHNLHLGIEESHLRQALASRSKTVLIGQGTQSIPVAVSKH